jgi:hypothetical protein
MTRLEKHRQKEFRRNVILSGIIIVALIIFAVFIGLKFIINASLFIGDLGEKKPAQSTTSDDFYGSLDVDGLPSATNSATLLVSGAVNNFDTVEYYLNNKVVGHVTPDKSGSFSDTIGDLKKGDNGIYVKAYTKDKKHVKKSDTFTVTYKNEKPKIDISEPSDKTNTDSEEIKVAGKTDKNVTIKINDLPVVVDSQGGFQQMVQLKDGDNKIVISAVDDAGNQDQKELTVTYQR